MKLLLAAVLVCGGICLLHRLALWAEGRGWIYYLRRRPSRSALGNAFLEVQAIVEPGKRVLLEARQQEPLDGDESGAPPGPDGGGEGDGRGGRGRA
jgi:hypothetical protein